MLMIPRYQEFYSDLQKLRRSSGVWREDAMKEKPKAGAAEPTRTKTNRLVAYTLPAFKSNEAQSRASIHCFALLYEPMSISNAGSP